MAVTDTSPAALRALADELSGISGSFTTRAAGAKQTLTAAEATLRALAAEKEAGAPALALDMERAKEWLDHSAPAPDANGWIPWGGGECPVPGGAHVRARTRDGSHLHWVASELEWAHRGHDTDVVAYCVSKEG